MWKSLAAVMRLYWRPWVNSRDRGVPTRGAIPLGGSLGTPECAMLFGARYLYTNNQRGRNQGLEVSKASGFTRERTPRVSTLHQVFNRLDRERFERVSGQWLQSRSMEE